MLFRRWWPGSAAWPPSRVRLFLFDIDGTLVSVRGAGRAAFARALEETYGTAGAIDRYDFRGRTDLRIVDELMTAAGVDAGRIRARLDDCFQAYVRERARALGHDVTFDRMTIIGDTPLDVECARGCGAVAVAVATGQHPADELVMCEPDLLFGDLADVDRVVALLTNGGP